MLVCVYVIYISKDIRDEVGSGKGRDGGGREGSGAWAYQTQLRIDLQGDPAE